MGNLLPGGRVVGVTVVSKGWQVPSLVVLPVGPSGVDDGDSVPTVKRHKSVLFCFSVCVLSHADRTRKQQHQQQQRKKGVN